jgi:hypothetical protein
MSNIAFSAGKSSIGAWAVPTSRVEETASTHISLCNFADLACSDFTASISGAFPINLDPRVQVAAEEIAHGQLTEEGETASKGLGAIEGAIFGLLGLILAFSFSGALTRFDARRHLVIEEANDIGTAWLRVALLPADA